MEGNNLNNEEILEKQEELLSMIEALDNKNIEEKTKYLPYISSKCSLYNKGEIFTYV